jgi:hypothetical protein
MENKNLLSPQEIAKQKRDKQLAILKASNELLEQEKAKVLQTKKLTDLEKTERIKSLEEAQRENYVKGQTYLNATKEEVENSVYSEASEASKEEYERHLKAKGMTDEQMHQKAIITAEYNNEKKDAKKKNGERRPRITNAMIKEEMRIEKDIMEKTLVKDEKQVQEHIKKQEDEKEKVEAKQLKNEEEQVKKNTNVKKKKSVVVDVEQDEKKVNEKIATQSKNEISENTKRKGKSSYIEYNFDFSSIPDYVQYDVIPLPSGGECYPETSPLRSGRIPVAYLTASDENLIASPNLYRDGKIIDVILERKVLDKSIDTKKLCKGDRDAIVLWLRATGFGTDFPIVVTNPNDETKQYNTTIDLSQLDYLDFNLIGDENGLFNYKLENGSVLKFRLMTYDDQEKLRDETLGEYYERDRYDIYRKVNDVKNILSRMTDIDEEMKGNLNEDLEEILTWCDLDSHTNDFGYGNIITNQLELLTVSVNGITDREYIKNYIENMRSIESYRYRNYIRDNYPGVDFSIKINIPESDGGGSIDTFLKIDNAIFLNV